MEKIERLLEIAKRAEMIAQTAADNAARLGINNDYYSAFCRISADAAECSVRCVKSAEILTSAISATPGGITYFSGE